MGLLQEWDGKTDWNIDGREFSEAADRKVQDEVHEKEADQKTEGLIKYSHQRIWRRALSSVLSLSKEEQTQFNPINIY